jgi:hypothetical protein
VSPADPWGSPVRLVAEMSGTCKSLSGRLADLLGRQDHQEGRSRPGVVIVNSVA